MESKGDVQNKRGELPVEIQIRGQNMTKGKMNPERNVLDSSSPGTGVEAIEHPRLSYREIQRTASAICRHAEVISEQEGSISLQVIVGVIP